MSFFASGIFFRGFSVFFLPVRDSLALTNAQTALVFSVARAEGGLGGPWAGWLIDRFGNRLLVVVGVILSAIGYFLFARVVHGFWSFALVYLGVISFGSSIAFQHAMFAGFNNWFRRRRSLTMSILAAISSLGGLVLVPLVSLMVLHLGWQWAAFAAGLTYLIGILPMTLILRNRPEDMGLLPDGDATPPVLAPAGRGGPSGRAASCETTLSRRRCARRPTGCCYLGPGCGNWPPLESWSTSCRFWWLRAPANKRPPTSWA